MESFKLNNCYLYVLDTMADWEIAHITAELNSGRFLKDGKVDIKKISENMNSITSMGGITINVDIKLSDVQFSKGDLLILPGADTWMDEKHKNIIELVESLINNEVVVASICGSTMALANSGVLNTKKHTSNGNGFLEMMCPNYKGNNHYIDDLVVCDGNLITASGLAPLEFAYEIIKKIQVMKEETLIAWYKLYSTKEANYFYTLMESIK